MKTKRYLLGIVVGILMSVPLMPAHAMDIAEPSALLTADAGYTADKAATTNQILSTAIKAEHATASASASRSHPNNDGMKGASTFATSMAASEVGHSPTIAGRDRLDEDVDEGAYADRFLARGPGDEDEDDAARRPGLIAIIPGDNVPSGDGDHELPQAA